ncbi:MAG TPA: sulfatase-like hydrolase/transferase [Blastocatellia bacterium]|nr:sulfatase-like hydrolase/transferase [Blastocatellia bacterium]
MTKRMLFIRLICCVCLGGVSAFAQTRQRPNILFILPDQMRAQAVGCMGNADVKTPNIDRLAAEGMLFKQTFANTPVCCPARANLLTGKYAHRNGMVANDLRLRESETTLAELLKAAGYRTGFVGKWHLDGGPREPGFVPPGERRQGFDFWAAHECSHRHFDNHYFRDDATPIKLGKFEAEGWTDIAVEFLRQTKAQPFFLMLQMGPPHDPYKAPPQYEALYDPLKLMMRPNWVEGTRMGIRQDIASYYAQITAIDDQVGRLLQTLKDLRLDENTIIVFTSDHGDMLGSQGLRLKRKPWEESIRVPGIIRYPRRIKAGQQTDAFLTHVDFAPTLLSLCGLKPLRTMQGTDLSRLMLWQTQHAPDSAFFQIFGPYNGDETSAGWRGVRTAQYMYARQRKQPWVLYDLARDPYEQNNLAADPAYAQLRQAMEQRLAAWMKRTGDDWSTDWTELVEDNGRLYTQGVFYTVPDYLKWVREHPETIPKKQD